MKKLFVLKVILIQFLLIGVSYAGPLNICKTKKSQKIFETITTSNNTELETSELSLFINTELLNCPDHSDGFEKQGLTVNINPENVFKLGWEEIEITALNAENKIIFQEKLFMGNLSVDTMYRPLLPLNSKTIVLRFTRFNQVVIRL